MFNYSVLLKCSCPTHIQTLNMKRTKNKIEYTRVRPYPTNNTKVDMQGKENFSAMISLIQIELNPTTRLCT